MSSDIKTVLITGCSETGIGHALCIEFQKRGYHVFATARTPSKMGTLQDLPRITCLELDVTSEESIRKAHEAVSATTNGTLDILVNNAAIAFVKPMLDFEMDEARLTMETNFWGPLNLIRTFAPDLIKSKGCIVNISTFVSKMYGPYMGIYAASKAALDTLGRSFGHELEPFGVRVITVMTGAIGTKYYTKFPPLSLPSNSYYHPVAHVMEQMLKGIDPPGMPKRTSPQDFAFKVVNDVEGGTWGTIWRGTMSTTIGFLLWLPETIMHVMGRSGAQLGLVTKAVQENQKNK